MTWRLHHPWWTHLPGAACVATLAVVLVLADPPARVPVHFGWNGEPNRWGPVWEMWIALVGLPLVMLAGSFAIDETYARHEDRRRFNWMAILDEALLGFLLGITIVLAPQLSSSQPALTGFWGTALGLGAVAAGVAAMLECLRPFRPMERVTPAGEGACLSAQDLETVGSQRRWQYWETQNPGYLRLLVPLIVAALAIGAVATFGQLPWLVPVFVVSILLVLSVYGGLHVSATRDYLAVRLGIAGIPLLRIRHSEIALVEVMTFGPLVDFGGWGIRYSLTKRMWGYFFAGTRGVKVTTTRKKQYLIGSDNPEYLVAVFAAAREAASARGEG